MGTLSYKTDGKGSVLLTLVGANGDVVSTIVTESYIKARAWAILADFDPDEVEGAAAFRPAAPQRRRVAAVTPPANASVMQRDKVLMALARGETRATPIAHQIGALRPSVSGRLIELTDAGLAVRLVQARGRGNASVYGLTPAGAARAVELGMTWTDFSPDVQALLALPAIDDIEVKIAAAVETSGMPEHVVRASFEAAR